MKIFFTSVTFALMLALLWPFSLFAANKNTRGAGTTATTEKQKTKRVEQKSARFVYPVRSSLAEVRRTRAKGASETSNGVYAPGEIIVKLRDNRMNLKQQKGKKRAQTFAARHKLVIKDWLTQANTVVVSAKGKQSLSDVIAQLKKDPNVVYAEPNFQHSLQKSN